MATKSNYKTEIRKISNPKTEKGVFANQDIKRGEIFGEMDSKVLTVEEYQKLPLECQKRYCADIDGDKFLCALDCENPGKFWLINHSCDPNLGSNGGYFQSVAMRDIKQWEELTLDYAMVDSGNDTSKMKCRCGSKNCRHVITSQDWKIPELQVKYRDFFQKNVQEKIDKQKRAVV